MGRHKVPPPLLDDEPSARVKAKKEKDHGGGKGHHQEKPAAKPPAGGGRAPVEQPHHPQVRLPSVPQAARGGRKVPDPPPAHSPAQKPAKEVTINAPKVEEPRPPDVVGHEVIFHGGKLTVKCKCQVNVVIDKVDNEIIIWERKL